MGENGGEKKLTRKKGCKHEGGDSSVDGSLNAKRNDFVDAAL